LPGNKVSAAQLFKQATERAELFRVHAFKLACAQNVID
jgi:hypothetical protein